MENNSEDTLRPRGLGLHSTATMINTVDIYNNPVNLKVLLETYNAVLIDFFRGTW